MSEPMERALTPARVKELLLHTWVKQSCQNPEHWPGVAEAAAGGQCSALRPEAPR